MNTKVKCVSPGGYSGMREGEIGTLVEKQPAFSDSSTPSGFTWPEYWIVETKDGEQVCGHTYRFEEVT